MIGIRQGCFGDVRTRILSVPGAGPPILLLHGFGDRAETWRLVLNRLEDAGLRAHAMDLPGFGGADPLAPGPMAVQFDAFVDAALDDWGPLVLVGNSLGAATAVRAGARRPDAVLGVIALNDPLNARHLPARLARAHRVPPTVWRAAARLPVPRPVLRWATAQTVRRVLYGPGNRPDPAVLAQWRRTVAGAADLSQLARGAMDYAYETGSAHGGITVSCPTLIVHGGQDRIIPIGSSHRLHQQLSGSGFVVLPRAGHCPQLDAPEDVTELIVAMHRSCATGAGELAR